MRSQLQDEPRLSAIDLFCGVGGLTHGLVLGGIDVIAGVDLDPACRYPFEANNPSVFLERDILNIGASEVVNLWGDKQSEYRLLAGCAPCQPFSTYSRSGRSKKRPADWMLVSKFGELVHEIQPELVTMENVPQVVDHPVFHEFLEHLTGYQKRWQVVECSMLGVPQSRKRLIFVASKLPDPGLEIVPPLFETQKTVRDTITDLPPIEAGTSHPSDPLHTAPRLSPLNLRRIKASRPGGTWRDWDPTLQAACHKRQSGETYPSVYGRMEWDNIAPTMTTQCFGYGNGRFGHPAQDRAISLREAAMLQTFPRDYKFVPDGAPVRFNKLGRLIGNAVPVRLGEFVAEILTNHVRQHAAAHNS